MLTSPISIVNDDESVIYPRRKGKLNMHVIRRRAYSLVRIGKSAITKPALRHSRLSDVSEEDNTEEPALAALSALEAQKEIMRWMVVLSKLIQKESSSHSTEMMPVTAGLDAGEMAGLGPSRSGPMGTHFISDICHFGIRTKTLL